MKSDPPKKRDGRGGKRPGAGKPKGTLWPSTIAKAQALELTRQYLNSHLPSLFDAHIQHAKGVGHLMMRDPTTGKFERVVTTGDREKDEAIIDAAISTGQACWIYLKDPSTQSFSELLNRALGKSTEHVELTGEDGGPVELVVSWRKS